MKARKSRTWGAATAVALGALALVVAVSPALAGEPLVVVKASKHKAGPYLHDTQSLNIPVGESKNAYWRVKNISDKRLRLTFDDAATGGNPEGYRVRWFDKRHRNISSAVKGAGYVFRLRVGKTKMFSATVKHLADSLPPSFCLGGQAFVPATFADSAYFGVNGDCG